MADSFVQVPPDSTGKQIATNDVGGKQYQVINLADDAGNPISPLTDTQLRATPVPVSLSSIPLATGAATETTLSAIKTKLPTASVDMPKGQTPSLPVRQSPLKYYDWSFAKAISNNVDTSKGTLLRTGTGQTVNQTGGNLVITTGTTANAETVIRSTSTFNGALTLKAFPILSQRIANNNFYVELVDVIGDSLTYNIVSAVLVDVTKTAHGFTTENIGQRIDICAITGASGIPMEGVIQSIPNADTIRFTVAGWPATGTGTCSLTGWNKVEVLYTSTAATNFAVNTRRQGWQNASTAVTCSTTAAPGHIFAVNVSSGVMSVSDQTPLITGALFDRGSFSSNIPEPNVDMYLQVRAKNGTVAPASTTTLTLGFLRIEDYIAQTVELSGTRAQSSNNAFNVKFISGTGSNVVLASQGTASTSTPWTTTFYPPLSGTDVASSALTTTTTTAAITPTEGTGYTIIVGVTAVTGTNPTLDIAVEESDDATGSWFKVYDFERITTTGNYRSPILKFRGQRIRFVQTVGGTTPSFTRLITRTRNNAAIGQNIRLIDRTIVPNTLNSTSAIINCNGCQEFNLSVRCTAQTTPATIVLQFSDNGVDWFTSTDTVATAVGTVRVKTTNEQWCFVRAIVTAAGTGITLGELSIKGGGV